MDMEAVWMVFSAGILTAVFNLVLELTNRPRYKMPVNIAAFVAVLTVVLTEVYNLVRLAETLFLRW